MRMRLLPTLKLPEGVTASNFGMTGSGDEVASHVEVSGVVSKADLSSFLEEQIRAQGWSSQANWASRHSSGSVWSIETADDGLQIGTLHLLDAGIDPVRVRFTVTPAGATEGQHFGSWGSRSN